MTELETLVKIKLDSLFNTVYLYKYGNINDDIEAPSAKEVKKIIIRLLRKYCT